MIFKIICIFMGLLIPASGYVTICPEGNGETVLVHLITDLCDAHDCTRSFVDHNESETNGRQHRETCGDRSVIDEYLTVQNGHCIIAPVAPVQYIDDLFLPTCKIPVFSAISAPYASDHKNPFFLRI